MKAETPTMEYSARPFGDCYKSSLIGAEELTKLKLQFESGKSEDETLGHLYEHLGLKDEIEVVHGHAVPPDGLDEGRKILHAWIEVGPLAIETSNDQKMRFTKDEYYENHSITPVARYSVDEARCLANAHGNYSAWHTLES